MGWYQISLKSSLSFMDGWLLVWHRRHQMSYVLSLFLTRILKSYLIICCYCKSIPLTYSKSLSVAHDRVGLIRSHILAGSLSEDRNTLWGQWIEGSMAVEKGYMYWNRAQPCELGKMKHTYSVLVFHCLIKHIGCQKSNDK